jgi:hypothetical protein
VSRLQSLEGVFDTTKLDISAPPSCSALHISASKPGLGSASTTYTGCMALGAAKSQSLPEQPQLHAHSCNNTTIGGPGKLLADRRILLSPRTCKRPYYRSTKQPKQQQGHAECQEREEYAELPDSRTNQGCLVMSANINNSSFVVACRLSWHGDMADGCCANTVCL